MRHPLTPLLFAAIVALACLLFASCAIIPTQHGKAQFWGDYGDVQFDDGSVHFKARYATHSTVVRAHWHGISNLGSEVVAGAIGLHGGSAAVGMAAIIPPLVNRPTNRPTAASRP